MSEMTISEVPAGLPSGELQPPARRIVWGLWLVGLLGLMAWRRETLSLPPYEDQAVGLWTEADFLAESGFNYYALRYEQSHFMSPNSGVRSYMISVLPTLVAVLMRAAPSPRASLIVGHVLTMAAASGCCVLVWRLARGWIGDAAALVLGVLLAVTPLFTVQAEMLGMDLPLTFITLWSLALVQRGRWQVAACAGFGAFLMKATGALVTGGMIACVLAWWWSASLIAMPIDRRAVGRALALNLLFLALEFCLVSWGDTSREVRRLIDWPACLRLPAAWNWCPDVLAAVCLAGVATAFRLSVLWRTPDGASGRWRLAKLVHDELQHRSANVLAWCILVGLLIACSRYILIPRYFTCGAALALVALAGAFHTPSPILRRFVAAGLSIWAGLNVVNAEGRFFPDIQAAAGDDFARHARLHARSCPFTERSREYLADHRANLALLAWLERDHADEPVLLPLPYLYYATKPRLGYVTKPLLALDAGDFSSALHAFTERSTPSADGAWQTPLLVWTGASRLTLPPPRTATAMLYDDGLQPPVKVYRAQIDPAVTDRGQLADWFLTQTRSADFLRFHSRVSRDNLGTWAMTLLPELFSQQRYLAESLMMAELNLLADYSAMAGIDLSLYPELAQSDPSQGNLRTLAEVIRVQGFSGGQQVVGSLLKNEASAAVPAAALYAGAWCEAASGRMEAARMLAVRLENSHQFPLDSRLLWAKIAWHEGDFLQTEQHAQQALAADPRSAAAQYWLSLLAGRRGEPERARQHMLAFVRRLPQLLGAEELAKRVPPDE